MTGDDTSPPSYRHILPTGPGGNGICVDEIGEPDRFRTILAIHGLGSASTLAFRPTIDQLTDQPLRFLLLDLPGFGHSERPDDWSWSLDGLADVVATTLDALTDDAVDVLGHSLGGSVAVVLAARHPALVRKLILAEPVLNAGAETLSAHIAAQDEHRYRSRGHQALLAIARRQAARRDAGARMFAATLDLAGPIAMYRSACALRARRSPSLVDTLRDVPHPRVMIAGAASPYRPTLAALSYPCQVVPDAGHAMMADNPSGFANALRLTLDDQPRRSPDPH